MVMPRKKKEKEKDIIDQMLDNIDFRGLTQDGVVGQDGLIKQLTGRLLFHHGTESRSNHTCGHFCFMLRKMPVWASTRKGSSYQPSGVLTETPLDIVYPKMLDSFLKNT
jgi:hypothetical protein